MTRPLRLEFAGALYHVTSRGDRGEDIYKDAFDRIAWLDVLRQVCDRCNFVVHSFCQMNNHYHLMLETVDGNLAQGMRLLNGLYTQYFNRRHHVVGHLFQGRYKAILVQKQSYLLELTRYIVLNPIRANFVRSLNDWEWSSHHHVLGLKPTPAWLETEWLLRQFGVNRGSALEAYCRFVMEGRDIENPLKDTKFQLLLGDGEFVAKYQNCDSPHFPAEISRTQRRSSALSVAEYGEKFPDRDEAMARAYFSTAYTMAEIGKHFGVTYRTVSRAVKNFKACAQQDK